MNLTIDLLELWLIQEQTDPGLQDLIRTMGEICEDKHEKYHHFAVSQDKIGWRRFMEGMISKECAEIQQQWFQHCAAKRTIKRWTTSLITIH